MNKNNTYISISVVVILILIIWGMYFINNRNAVPKVNYDDFAKCLSDKGAVMYGADWCVNCTEEKKRFGNSFKFVNYVECPDNADLCTEKGIEGFPTWIIGGQSYLGQQGLQKLSLITNCPLPEPVK